MLARFDRQKALKSSAIALVLLATAQARAADYYVATDGDDATGDGSLSKPWRTIGHAVNQGIPASGGDTVRVRDGVYEGLTTITRGFAAQVTVRAENAYRAKLTNVKGGMEALRVYVNGSANLLVQGFEFTNLDPNYTCVQREQYFLIQLQDASDVTLENNIIHGNAAAGRCNELLKINRSIDTAYPKNIVVRGNLFYDQVNADGADMIDSVRPGEIEIVDNVFWGDPIKTHAQSFMTLKRQAPASGTPKSPRYHIHRNFLMRWGGKTDQAFVQLGEDGVDFVEISDALIENNVFLGDSKATMAAPVQLKGAENIRVRANTTSGDLPSGAYGARIGTEGSNPAVSGFEFRNNVFSDPTGTMGTRLLNVYGLAQVSSIVLDSNLYFNAGAALPVEGAVIPSSDPQKIVADPLLPSDQSNIVLPEFNPTTGVFPSGSHTIREEFLRLVEKYAAPGDSSPVKDSADSSDMPSDDVRGLARDSKPDRGAYELGANVTAPDAGIGGTPGNGGDGSVASGGNASGGKNGGGNDAGSPKANAESGDEGGCGCRVERSAGDRDGFLIACALAWLARRLSRRRIAAD